MNIFPTQIEEIVLVTEGVSPHFQLLLTRKRPDGPADRAGGGGASGPGGRRESAATEIAARVKDGVGVSVAVEVVDPGTLERSMGKMRRVIDQRHPDECRAGPARPPQPPAARGPGAAAPGTTWSRCWPWR